VGFKTGLLIGAAAGYVLGAKAGRERYEQIKHWLGSAARSEPLAGLAGKGKAFAEEHLPFSADRASEG
jgi:hypothetical protein